MFPVDGEGRGAWEGLRKKKRKKETYWNHKKKTFFFSMEKTDQLEKEGKKGKII